MRNVHFAASKSQSIGKAGMRTNSYSASIRGFNGSPHYLGVAGMHTARDVRRRYDIEDSCVAGCTRRPGVFAEVSVQVDCARGIFWTGHGNVGFD
jgi:hypothetical protein